MLLGLLNAVCAAADEAPILHSVELTSSTQIEFASLEQGIAIVAERDAYVRAMSRIDRQIRMQTAGEPTEGEYLEFVAREVRSWSPAEITNASRVFDGIRAKLAKFEFSKSDGLWPKRIWLVKTSGNEESNAAYCRQGAIVLPQRMLRRSDNQLERLLIHELFHVLSRHNERLRRRLYATIGFHSCPEVTLPGRLLDLKITNPDGPVIDSYMEIESEGERIRIVPVLYAKRAYDAKQPESLFQMMEFKLMAVVDRDGVWSASLTEGEPRLLEPTPEGAPSFFAQIGENTKYIIHPDEILADNFVHLINATPNLPTPRIVEHMGDLLMHDQIPALRQEGER